MNPTKPPLHKAVFLDRDGTINRDTGYLHRIEDLEIFPWASEAIHRLNQAGYLVVVVTNQSGVARGMYDLTDVHKLHEEIDRRLAENDARIDRYYICPHHPDADHENYGMTCDCRKGQPGMLLQAAMELGIDLKSSFMIGDKQSDVEAGLSAGCTSIQLAERSTHGKLTFPDLLNACNYIIEISTADNSHKTFRP